MQFLLVGFSFRLYNLLKVSDKTLDTSATKEKQTPQTLRIEALELPSVMTFAGERVPLQDTDVRERLDREIHVNTYWHSNMLLMIKKANRFFSEIEPLLKKYNLPDDFKYLAVAESGLDNVRPQVQGLLVFGNL